MSAVTLSDDVAPPINTDAAHDEALASTQDLASTQNQERQRAWSQVIDDKLIEWGSHPEILEDKDFVPPTAKSLARAADIAMFFRDDVAPLPTGVVPDGDGGLTFERQSGTLFESLNIYEDGSVEILVFEDGRLRDRKKVPF